jgi:hypothetical protein
MIRLPPPTMASDGAVMPGQTNVTTPDPSAGNAAVRPWFLLFVVRSSDM